MIILYSGIPGSGKTYKMMYDLARVKDDFYVVHNIDGVRAGFLGEESCHFVEYCEKEGMEIQDFFSKEYQIEFTKAVKEKYNKNCLVIIDESHEWFSKKHQKLVMWLSYHRHLNQTIWLVAHKSTNIPTIYRSFVQEEYRAKHSGIVSIPGFFMYNRIIGGERVGYKFARIKQEIFDLYKSQNSGFKKQRPSLLLPIVILVVIVVLYFFFTMPGRAFKKGKGQNTEKTKEVNQVIVPVNTSSDLDGRYRFAGVIGDKILIEDIKLKNVFEVSELSGYVLLEVKNNFIKLFDTKLKRNVFVYSVSNKADFRLTQEAENPRKNTTKK